jgi:3-hydroxy-9,10-secoandrosta-1,3,5(10)-triene-9,17-dione monooxygenase reductase component
MVRGLMVDDGILRIGSDPYLPPLSDRDSARRFRGRLSAPVTIWTSNTRDNGFIGATVSSLIVAEGEEPTVIALLQPLSEFWEELRIAERFVVHVASSDELRIANEFAGLYPGPTSWEGYEVLHSDWGPVLPRLKTRAYCKLDGVSEAGESLVVRGTIEKIDLDNAESPPLVHYRSRYYTLTPRN